MARTKQGRVASRGEQMRKPAGSQAEAATSGLYTRPGTPRRAGTSTPPIRGCLSLAGGTPTTAFVRRPREGEGVEAGKAEQRAPESARRAPAPRLAAPFPPSAARSLFPPGGRGPRGRRSWRPGTARDTYVSLWSSARRSLGTLRR